MGRKASQSRSTSRGRKTSKSPGKGKKTPAKRSPSKNRSNSRGRPTKARKGESERTPSKTRTPATKKATPPRTVSRSSSRPRPQQSPGVSSNARQALSESTAEEIRQRVARVREATRYAPAPSSSPSSRFKGLSSQKSFFWDKLCPFSWCKGRPLHSYFSENQKDLLASALLLAFIFSLVYFILYVEPREVRQWLERIPSNGISFWKTKVFPKIKFW